LSTGCADNDLTPHITVLREQFKVSQGPHTIQTQVHSVTTGPAVAGWEVQYTIYERKVHGTN